MKQTNPLILILAVIGGFVVLGLVLKVAFKLIGLLLLLAVGVAIYFFVQRATGKGR
jgi:hypothetical protein